MKRRHFLAASALFATHKLFSVPSSFFSRKNGIIFSVNGQLNVRKMGICLVHEHILVDFIGAEKVSPNRYDADEVFEKALPFLHELKKTGCTTLFECTPAYLGRDAALMKRLSDASGINIISNTGYYGARNDECLPPHAFTETAEQLAQRWIGEFNNGIEGAGIKPGFIKIGIDSGRLSEVDKKLVEAAAITHIKTGLTIACHTGVAEGAFDVIDTIKAAGVDPSAYVWVHAQSEKDTANHIKAAKEGVWVELDGVSEKSLEEHIAFTLRLKEENLLNRVLISHDAGWYHVGEEGGGSYRGYTTVFDKYIPQLKTKGFSQKDIDTLFIHNPIEAFAIRVRKGK